MIGIYGGTFDPIHLGHLRVALEISETLGLSELRFIPCQIPPHRGAPGASAEQRLRLLQAALKNAPTQFTIDTLELDRVGPSYMVDTLQTIRREIGELSPMALILGMDAFMGLPGWHCWKIVADLAHIVVMSRPGFQPDWPYELEHGLRHRTVSAMDELHHHPSGRIWFTDVTVLDISASKIRSLLNQGLSPRYLTPDPVLDLIGEMGLYQSECLTKGKLEGLGSVTLHGIDGMGNADPQISER